jgi:hypothetical protein
LYDGDTLTRCLIWQAGWRPPIQDELRNAIRKELAQIRNEIRNIYESDQNGTKIRKATQIDTKQTEIEFTAQAEF